MSSPLSTSRPQSCGTSSMNKDLLLYFLVMLVPLVLLPVATHRLLTQELDHGKTLGTTYLQTKAELIAAQMQAAGTQTIPRKGTDPICIALFDARGQSLDPAFPTDGRCFGEAALAPNRTVRVAWAGTPSPGFARRTKLARAETLVVAGSSLVFLIGLGMLVHAVFRARREARQQLDYVDDFSHRLKTPLTSISLCAELAKSGRLSQGLDKEATETVAAETAKLNALVDEVLAYIGEHRHG